MEDTNVVNADTKVVGSCNNDVQPLPLSKSKRKGREKCVRCGAPYEVKLRSSDVKPQSSVVKLKFTQHCVDEDLTLPDCSLTQVSDESPEEEREAWKNTFSRAYMCSYDGKWDSTDDYMFVIKRCTNQESIMKKFLKTSNISQVKISAIHYIILRTDDCVAESNPEQKVSRMLLICKDRHGAEIHTLYEDVCDFPNLLLEYSKTELALEREEAAAKGVEQKGRDESTIKCVFNDGSGACKCDGCSAEFKNIDTLYDYAHGCFDKL